MRYELEFEDNDGHIKKVSTTESPFLVIKRMKKIGYRFRQDKTLLLKRQAIGKPSPIIQKFSKVMAKAVQGDVEAQEKLRAIPNGSDLAETLYHARIPSNR